MECGRKLYKACMMNPFCSKESAPLFSPMESQEVVATVGRYCSTCYRRDVFDTWSKGALRVRSEATGVFKKSSITRGTSTCTLYLDLDLDFEVRNDKQVPSDR